MFSWLSQARPATGHAAERDEKARLLLEQQIASLMDRHVNLEDVSAVGGVFGVELHEYKSPQSDTRIFIGAKKYENGEIRVNYNADSTTKTVRIFIAFPQQLCLTVPDMEQLLQIHPARSLLTDRAVEFDFVRSTSDRTEQLGMSGVALGQTPDSCAQFLNVTAANRASPAPAP